MFFPGRRGVTLGKPDIKVETINKETHSLEEDSGSVSTATRMVKAMYSVSQHTQQYLKDVEGLWDLKLLISQLNYFKLDISDPENKPFFNSVLH